MTDFKHIIPPERMGIWLTVSFIVSLVALVVAFVSIQRLNTATYLTQLQIIQLNQKINANQDGSSQPASTEAVKQ